MCAIIFDESLKCKYISFVEKRLINDMVHRAISSTPSNWMCVCVRGWEELNRNEIKFIPIQSLWNLSCLVLSCLKQCMYEMAEPYTCKLICSGELPSWIWCEQLQTNQSVDVALPPLVYYSLCRTLTALYSNSNGFPYAQLPAISRMNWTTTTTNRTGIYVVVFVVIDQEN